MESFGVPLQNLKQILDMKASDRAKAGQPGIPKDSLDNQLKEWLLNSRRANIDINNKELEIAIKGDAKEEYATIKQVMDILQEQKINNFIEKSLCWQPFAANPRNFVNICPGFTKPSRYYFIHTSEV